MTQALSGCVALVTGASSGIGAATAGSLCAHGATTVLVARRRERLEGVARTIRASGATSLVVEADVTDQEQAAAAVERAVAEFGRLDIVINNAGVLAMGPVLETPAAEWRAMVTTNIEAVLQVTAAAVQHLVRAAEDSPRQVADLINISSTSGRVQRPGTAVYSLTKAGINAYSESLRQELIPHGVRVSVIEPGTVQTELIAKPSDDTSDPAPSKSAGIELLQSEDIADAIAYMVTRPRRVAVNSMLLRAGAQTW